MSAKVEEEAFVTLATNDHYCVGALVLAHSLKCVRTNRSLVVMISSDVTPTMRNVLSTIFNQVVEVNIMDSNDPENLDLLNRPELGITFTKLHCWRLTQYSKCVFMDADTLAIKNIDDLFAREELSACADVGWPDCFNSGLFVFRPSDETYNQLVKFAVTRGSFDGGDQGLLNLFFHDWSTRDISRRLPFLYNLVTQACTMYQPAFKQYGENAKVLHFIGPKKPWQYSYDTSLGEVIVSDEINHASNFLQLWWKIFVEKVQPELDCAFEVYFFVRGGPKSEGKLDGGHGRICQWIHTTDFEVRPSTGLYTIKLKIRNKKRPPPPKTHTESLSSN